MTHVADLAHAVERLRLARSRAAIARVLRDQAFVTTTTGARALLDTDELVAACRRAGLPIRARAVREAMRVAGVLASTPPDAPFAQLPYARQALLCTLGDLRWVERAALDVEGSGASLADVRAFVHALWEEKVEREMLIWDVLARTRRSDPAAEAASYALVARLLQAEPLPPDVVERVRAFGRPRPPRRKDRAPVRQSRQVPREEGAQRFSA